MTERTAALNNRQVMRAAGVVLIGFLASGILGLVRTSVFSGMFGAGAELDAFLAAQRIPELLYVVVAGGALGSSFIPVFSRFLSQEDTETAWQLASAVMTLSGLAAGIASIILFILAPWYMPLLYSGEQYIELAVQLTQLMMVTTLIFSISGLLMGILNAHQNFLLPALALSMYNLGMIFGAFVIAPALSTTSGVFAYPPIRPLIAAQLLPEIDQFVKYAAPGGANIYGLALGAVLGSSLHLLIQLPGLRGIDANLRFLPDFRVSGVLEVLRLMLPRVLGLATAQINFLVNIFFATRMIPGSLTALNWAWYLLFFTLGVIGQSVGTAVFPSLAALASAEDFDGYRDRLAGAIRNVLLLAIPATAGMLLLGKPIIALLFQRGAWTAEDTTATAWALSFYALGIAGHALLEVLSRAFYALADTLTPVLIGIASLGSNIVLSIIFIQFIGDPNVLARGPFAGLALANSLTTLLEGLVLWWLLSRRVNGINDRYIIDGIMRMLLATLGMSSAVWGVTLALAGSSNLILTGAGIAVGGLVFFGLAIALRVEEARLLPGMILRRVKR